MTVGQRIKEKREELELSQTELAKIMNVSRQAISKAELHDSNITTDKVRKFANALGVTEAYLMGWEKLEKFGEEVRKDGYTFEILTIPEDEVDSVESLVITDKEEYELIQLFRNADNETKRMIVEMLAFFKSKNQD